MNGLCIKVYGKVQGVWFRKGTQLKANELGVYGDVKNLPDGSVQINVFGTIDKIKKMQAWCLRGTPNAQVDKVEHFAIPYLEKKEFLIIR